MAPTTLPRRSTTLRPAALSASLLLPLLTATGAAHAQWTATVLTQTPAHEAMATAVHGNQQGGYFRQAAPGFPNSARRAMLWQGSAARAIDLTPPVATEAQIFDIHGDTQVGVAWVNGGGHACVWNGTANSWVSLRAPIHGWNSSVARAVHNGQQVGRVTIAGLSFAALWTGSAESFVNLTPQSASQSEAYGVHAGQQVGFTLDANLNRRACFWRGTPASWRSLHPAGARYSYALDVWNGQQVGVVSFSGSPQAALWSGTAASFVSLGTNAEAHAIHAGYQAGSIMCGISPVRNCAAVWRGTPESMENLADALPGHYDTSAAYGIWSDGETLHVVGIASTFNPQGQIASSDAILWTRPIPCPSEWNNDGAVNSGDISAFITAWIDSVASGNLNADFNHDEVVNSTDISRFISVWLNDVTSGGC